jgi:hypothetical protein
MPPDPDAGRFDALYRAKDRLILLALQDAERYYRNRAETDEQEAADDIVDEAFDQAVLDYVREMAKAASQRD